MKVRNIDRQPRPRRRRASVFLLKPETTYGVTPGGGEAARLRRAYRRDVDALMGAIPRFVDEVNRAAGVLFEVDAPGGAVDSPRSIDISPLPPAPVRPQGPAGVKR